MSPILSYASSNENGGHCLHTLSHVPSYTCTASYKSSTGNEVMGNKCNAAMLITFCDTPTQIAFGCSTLHCYVINNLIDPYHKLT